MSFKPAKQITKIITIICLIVSLIFFVQNTIPQFFKPMVTSEDGYSRLSSAVAFSSPVTRTKNDFVWPPLTKVLYSLPYLIYPHNNYISVRFFSWVLIVFTIILIGLISYRFTKNITISLFALSLALINPLLINLSVQTLSENIWIFCIGLSLYFITSTQKKYWQYGYIFWCLSQMCRYESWYLTPLVIIFFWFYHRQLIPTIDFLGYSLIFPIYWYTLTSFSTGNYRYYLNEKLRQAAHGSPQIYHHFFNTMSAWLTTLNNLFSPILIGAFMGGIIQYVKKKNLLFTIPTFIFTSLVFQVYFATMEITPARYLAILPLTIIPLLALIISSIKNSLLTKVLIFTLLFTTEIILAPKKIQSLTEYLFPDQLELCQYIVKLHPPLVTYVKNSNSFINGNTSFWYFSKLPMTSILFSNSSNPSNLDYPIISSESVLILEKTSPLQSKQNTLPNNFPTPIFENKSFQVYQLSNVK